MDSIKRRLAKKVNHFLRFHGKDTSMQATIERYRESGMQIGRNVVIYDSLFDAVYPYLITIGNHCTLTRTEILAHDDSLVIFNGHRFVAPVTIGDHVFLGRGSIIMPGVTIGSRVIVGAGAIVTKDIPDGAVVAGNPAKVIASVDDVIQRKLASGKMIPHRFGSNLVSYDEDVEVAKIVKMWASSGFNSWKMANEDRG
jgi:acetyltransferase-like isoleucine patch superfamily enzyme